MTAVDVALLLVAAGVLLALVRALRGPLTADRAVAGELVFVAAVGAVALVAVRVGSSLLLDLVLVAVLVGFLATVALARLVDREEEAP